MSLQFIMGPSGAGKSHYLYEWVTKESLEHSDKHYIVLVPEQFTMQTQKDLVMASPRKGIMNVEVLSFHRLAQRVFEETGEHQKIILDDAGKNFVIRKIAGEHEKDLKIIGSNLRKIGYISEIKSILSEFTQYDIQPEFLEEMLEKTEQQSSLSHKLYDIKVVYENFKNYLKEKYITNEEILDVLASVAHQSELLKDSVVVLDGFTGFTPVQNKLLKELLKICGEVLVTVTMDDRENPFSYAHPYQLFALSKQMVTTLAKVAKEERIEVKTPIYLYQKPIYRFQNNEALAFLESHIFRYSKETYDEYQDNVQIWCAKNPYEEIDFVAQKIRYLIRKKEYRYQDMAVLTNGMQDYATYIERIFEQYGIPVFMDSKRSILLNSFVEYIRSLLAMAEQNFSYESVFRYLRTGLSVLSREEIDVLENYVVALGIRGRKKWQEKWIRRTKRMEEHELSEVNRIREKFVSSIETVVEVLVKRSKTVLDVTRALHQFFLQEDLQKQVQEYQFKFESEGELALAKEYAQVYRIVIELLDKFVELLGEEKISLQEYCELLDAGLEEAKVGIIPPSLDQVVIGDVERSRIKDVKVVFLIGASDNHIPGNTGNQGLLSEYDRQMLSESGAVLAPNVKEKIYIQKFYLYQMLTKPTDQVYLTYSKTSSDGKTSRPSYLILDVLKLFTLLRVQSVSDAIIEKEITEQSGIASLIKGLQKKGEGLTKEWQELYTWYKKQPQWQEKLTQLLDATFYKKPESVLTRETAKRLYGEILENSVSRLEQFSQCAYSHFLSYGLKINEREVYQFQSFDLGNLFHGSLERFSYKIERAGLSWTALTEEQQERFIQESVEEYIADYGNSILYSSARNEYVITRLTRMMHRTVWALKRQLEKGDFIPDGYEVSFGGFRDLQTSNVDLGELGKLRLRGRIDRIDICKGGDKIYVKIIDYKTGNKTFDWNELCYGLQLQLAVYMNAAVEMQRHKHPDKEIVPAGLFYYIMKDPIVDKDKDSQRIENAILKELRPNGIVQNDGEVIRHLDRELSGTSQVAPVSKNKDGTLRANPYVLSAKEFELLAEHARGQVVKIGKQILEGDARIEPYKMDKANGCSFCPYHAICGFDEKLQGYRYRELEKLNREQIFEKMQEEVDSWQ